MAWILCTDQLPDDERQVIVAKKNRLGKVTCGFAYYYEHFKNYKGEYEPQWVCPGSDNVFAWMDIPSLPEV